MLALPTSEWQRYDKLDTGELAHLLLELAAMPTRPNCANTSVDQRCQKALATCRAPRHADTCPLRRCSRMGGLPRDLERGGSKYGTMNVRKVLYSAPSRLVGRRLKVRIYSDKLECWLGNVCVLEPRRGQSDGGERAG
jgi:hypothetical protein